MYDTLTPLVERAMMGNRRPLEFYLREQSRLPGQRANLELMNDLSHLLAVLTQEQPDSVRALLNHLIHHHYKGVASNTPEEFVMLCGVVSFGACAAVKPEWRGETIEFLNDCAGNGSWRVREGVAIAFQRLLQLTPQETLHHLTGLARTGDYWQQRAAVASVAEPALLNAPEMVKGALEIQRVVLGRLRLAPAGERKREDLRGLRKALGYTLSVVTAAAPEEGFTLMRDGASWGDTDIVWILRENLKKKRLAKFADHSGELSRLLDGASEV